MSIGSADLSAEPMAGDTITPRGISMQGNTLAVDGSWPNLPAPEGQHGSYSPTWSLNVEPGSVKLMPDASYHAVGIFKIDEGNFFADVNADIVFDLDTLASLEVEPGGNETGDTLILSSLRITGVEAGEPYVADFQQIEYRRAGASTRAYIRGEIARSTLKGGRGRREIAAHFSGLL